MRLLGTEIRNTAYQLRRAVQKRMKNQDKTLYNNCGVRCVNGQEKQKIINFLSFIVLIVFYKNPKPKITIRYNILYLCACLSGSFFMNQPLSYTASTAMDKSWAGSPKQRLFAVFLLFDASSFDNILINNNP